MSTYTTVFVGFETFDVSHEFQDQLSKDNEFRISGNRSWQRGIIYHSFPHSDSVNLDLDQIAEWKDVLQAHYKETLGIVVPIRIIVDVDGD